jgi:hypothetical protein
VTAREYQGKWYNNVDLFKIESCKTAPVQQIQQPMQQPVYNQPAQPMYQQNIPSTPQVPPGVNTNPVSGDLPF